MPKTSDDIRFRLLQLRDRVAKERHCYMLADVGDPEAQHEATKSIFDILTGVIDATTPEKIDFLAVGLPGQSHRIHIHQGDTGICGTPLCGREHFRVENRGEAGPVLITQYFTSREADSPEDKIWSQGDIDAAGDNFYLLSVSFQAREAPPPPMAA